MISINQNEINQGIEAMRNVFIDFGRYLERKGLENTLANYEEFVNHMPYQYTRDEIIEIVNCYFANADIEDEDVVLVNKNDKDDVTVLERGFKYYWSYNNALSIHIRDGVNKIDINIDNVIESDDGDILDLGQFILDIL